jgi:hypothetical protein
MASIDTNPGAKFPFRYCAYRLPNGQMRFPINEANRSREGCSVLPYAGIVLARIESRSRDGKPRARELISEIARALTV